ncbi:VWA domain-containing protein [Mycobacterium deserti]|uniref:VWA domain-containing protein n=1 Tax=Mycobacterium deserti TaxID=2978347 RepID=A0ABT2M8B6_9MYCO|nr:VWA domain-containing protein [Mycobacterium deserti]MCT7658502.1 VWA domain-containing protein [Mycobacterium deserti]
MTFAPVLPAAILLVVAAVVILLRLLTMWQLASRAGQRWGTVWRWSGLTLAMLLLLIAAARPGIDHGDREATAAAQSGENTNVFFVVDRSTDSDMAAIRADVDGLIDRYPRARFAVIAFAARPSMDWPLSEDAFSLKPLISRLSPYPAAIGSGDQVNAAAAANVLRYQLIAAGQQYPDSRSLVFYLGSGATESRAPQGEFDPTAGSVDGGAVLGYGAAQDEQGLRRIAAQLGVPYEKRDDATPVADLAPGGDRQGETTVGQIPERTELYWVFTLSAALLLLFEVYLSIREFRSTRMARRDVAL